MGCANGTAMRSTNSMTRAATREELVAGRIIPPRRTLLAQREASVYKTGDGSLERFERSDCMMILSSSAGDPCRWESSLSQVLDEPELITAAGNGEAERVLLLLNNGTSPTMRSKTGGTALHAAAKYGHTSVVLALIEFSASLEVTDMQGMTALHWACRMGRDDIVEILLDRGASVTARCGAGYTAYALAEDYGSTTTVRLVKQRSGKR